MAEWLAYVELSQNAESEPSAVKTCAWRVDHGERLCGKRAAAEMDPNAWLVGLPPVGHVSAFLCPEHLHEQERLDKGESSVE